MPQFSGFPAGNLRFVNIPDFFFTHLVPQIDHLAELKITLHFLWLHARQGKHVVSQADLLADETLMQSLLPLDEQNLSELLVEGLRRAINRGTLLYTQIENETGRHDLYFLNSERGRHTQQKVEAGEMGVVVRSGSDIARPVKRPNIFELYEDNIGLISPIIADELKEAEQMYPPNWIEDAFKIAAENNVRRWKYIRTILERMASAGRGKFGQAAETTDKPWYTDEEFQDIIQH